MQKTLFIVIAILGLAVYACGTTISDAPDITISRTLTGAEQLPIAVKNVSLPYSITLNEISDFTLKDNISFGIDTSIYTNPHYINIGANFITGHTDGGTVYLNHPWGALIFVSSTDTIGYPTLKIDSNTGAIVTKAWVEAQYIKLQSADMPCDSNSAGSFNYRAGTSGVKDIVRVCAKDATDTYAWRTIY